MPRVSPDPQIATTVRLERDLRRQIEDAAKAAFRPVSREIAFRLKISFEQQPDEAAAS
jgi:hypothetical protein